MQVSLYMIRSCYWNNEIIIPECENSLIYKQFYGFTLNLFVFSPQVWG